MKTLFATFLFCALTLSAADVTGAWSGTLEMINPNGENKTRPLVMTLKQTGDEVTGTIGPRDDDQLPVLKGKVNGSKLMFEVDAHNDGIIKFVLNTTDDAITGEASGEHEGEPRKAKVDLKKKAN
jgi:hypothetical protein